MFHKSGWSGHNVEGLCLSFINSYEFENLFTWINEVGGKYNQDGKKRLQ